jgi:hypothetical protein
LSSPLMYEFLILSLLVFPTIAFRNFISTVCNLLFLSLSLSCYMSMSLLCIFWKYTYNIIVLYFLSISLFHNKLLAKW